jgi:hypothetical protein
VAAATKHTLLRFRLPLFFVAATAWMTIVFRLTTAQSWFEAVLGGVLIGAILASGQEIAWQRSSGRTRR